jgi:hypothetical protein
VFNDIRRQLSVLPGLLIHLPTAEAAEVAIEVAAPTADEAAVDIEDISDEAADVASLTGLSLPQAIARAAPRTVRIARVATVFMKTS